MKCELNESLSFSKTQRKIALLFIYSYFSSKTYLKLLKVRIKVMKAIFYHNSFAGCNKSRGFIICVFLVYPKIAIRLVIFHSWKQRILRMNNINKYVMMKCTEVEVETNTYNITKAC